MTLDKYMRTRKMKEEELAALLGVKQGTINRWRHGLRTPRPAVILQIDRLTGGTVGLADWVETPAEEAVA